MQPPSRLRLNTDKIMQKSTRKAQRRLPNLARGQVLVIVALAAVGIIAIVGIALDVGTLFIGNARLRRAVDSAALAAALQVRVGYTIGELEKTATEFLLLNGIHLDLEHPVTVNTCDTDPNLCYDPIRDTFIDRKFVSVTASATIPLSFLPVIGINSAPTTATATSETASMDVVLVLDRSESMTNAAEEQGNPMRDPSYCNIHPEEGRPGNENDGGCLPFNDVQDAAVTFVQSDYLFFPYDRVAIVTFDQVAQVVMDFSSDRDAIINAIRELTVFQGEDTGDEPPGADAIYPNGNPSRFYGSDDFIPDPDPVDYLGMTCQQIRDDTHPSYPDPSICTTTNIGDALREAGNRFAETPVVRQQALWAVVLLTDGMANAGYFNEDGSPATCPRDTWPDVAEKPIYCNDANSATRHASGSEEYDADDFAYDMADFVAFSADEGGQDALIFSVGYRVHLASFQQCDEVGNCTYPAEEFLRYAADMGRGIYYPVEQSLDLAPIFLKIAENIATRLTH